MAPPRPVEDRANRLGRRVGDPEQEARRLAGTRERNEAAPLRCSQSPACVATWLWSTSQRSAAPQPSASAAPSAISVRLTRAQAIAASWSAR